MTGARPSRNRRDIWFGIFVVVVVQMARTTPPIGFNPFVLQGMIGKDTARLAVRRQ